MKIATLNTVIATLNSINFDNAEVMAELVKELERAEQADVRKTAQRNANLKGYDAVKAIVMENLSVETPITLAELWDAISEDVPEGFTKGKLQYAMTRLWEDMVEKHEGKVNSYTLKA